MTGRWVTLREAARRFGTTERTIRRWAVRYEIRRVRAGKRVFYDVVQLADAELQAASNDPTRKLP